MGVRLEVGRGQSLVLHQEQRGNRVFWVEESLHHIGDLEIIAAGTCPKCIHSKEGDRGKSFREDFSIALDWRAAAYRWDAECSNVATCPLSACVGAEEESAWCEAGTTVISRRKEESGFPAM